jgi:hypothetical protein
MTALDDPEGPLRPPCCPPVNEVVFADTGAADQVVNP